MDNNSYIIVGLGNPGAKYKNNRHNIGWKIVEALATKYQCQWTKGKKYFLTEINFFGNKIYLCLPRTYMNLSGEAVLSLSTKFKINPRNIIAIVDEYNFPVGKIHFKLNGSDGGHNGISSIIENLGTTEFCRFRCGIDREFGAGELVDYVLADFPENQFQFIELMVKNSIEGLLYLFENGIIKGMQFINTNFKQEPSINIDTV